ncbi:MAG: efflux RND transporter permease subunit [Planctomycetota bacterium]|jgi:Cu(I)/Ag(I) efflux system membrane protein CusA/SilA
MLDRLIRFCLENKLIVALFLLLVIAWGILVAPFDWPWLEGLGLQRDPVPVDAIPDIGENQQIVFTRWQGRSPQDVQDQITYPLTVSLLGIPGVKTVRSYSYFGFSSIYVVFEDRIPEAQGDDFYWPRSRILEKLNSLPPGTLPPAVQPQLGPDATALGQIFWYTLEGEGFDLEELRSVQDWFVRYGLQAVEGVSEVASVGGFVREYQVDVDPDAMRAYGVKLREVYDAVRRANIDVGARTIEINRVEYVIRGLGFVKTVADLENTVVKERHNVPVYISNIAQVSTGPALRRGALDKEGAEAVGGVVVVRYGENPLAVIKRVKEKIAEIEPGLRSKTLPDGRTSQVKIVPFYDRTQLIHETLGTLENALTEEILVTILVVIFMVAHLRSSVLISGLLPLAVLMCFIAMSRFGVDSNIMSLTGIAIAIGTMVDMGIILTENILKHLEAAKPGESRLEVIYRAASEVGSAVVTAISTTVISFLPVFTMEGPEGKLFKPLAYTKTFALIASVIVALTVIPPLAHLFFGYRRKGDPRTRWRMVGTILVALAAFNWTTWWLGLAVLLVGVWPWVRKRLPEWAGQRMPIAANVLAFASVLLVLNGHWLPLGPERGSVRNVIFVGGIILGLLVIFRVFMRWYEPLLRYFLAHKLVFFSMPVAVMLFGVTVWQGFDKVFGFVPRALAVVGVPEQRVRTWGPWSRASHAFPGLGKEFMPRLDEGSFLYMPTTMPHASIGEAMDVLSKQDMAMRAIPEVKSVVGKIGRVESPLDPAPISMVETVVNYVPEYAPVDPETGERKRLWRDHIRSPQDIWDEIVKAAQIVGTTSAPPLQPIETRIVMLQTGMRAAMGVKVRGDDLEEVERVGLQIEKYLKEIPVVDAPAVVADRIVGKPYIEFELDRNAMARYGVNIRDVQDVVEIAIGGMRLTTTVERRERYPVRVRYLRELRDTWDALQRILVPTAGEAQVPLVQVARLRYVRGPQVIKSEDTRLVGYVTFGKARLEDAEVDVVEECQRYLAGKIESGEFQLPPGVTYDFAGSYENQVRAEKKLGVVLPLSLFVIFLILYFQFRSVSTTMLVFIGIFVAWAGGFLMLWLYAQEWFLNFSIFGESMRDLFQVHPVNLSVAVWVGFIALFGIASDDGVVIATYLKQTFEKRKIETKLDAREATVEAGKRRIRPCLMTTGTTLLALIPVITSRGRGADVMMPMAIPSIGGMAIELLTLFVVPVTYCMIQEWRLRTATVPDRKTTETPDLREE